MSEADKKQTPNTVSPDVAALAEFLVALERKGLIHINRRKLKPS